MKVTQLGRTRPIVGATTLGSSGGLIDGGTPPGAGSIPTATGSNTWAWGSNVGRIFVNGTTYVLGPDVNFADGSNTTVTVDMVGAVASNTIRIHSTGGGGASFGSNSNEVSYENAAGAGSNTSRSDHVHRGVTSFSHASNTYTGPVIITPGTGAAITSPVSGTFAIHASGGGGGGSSSSYWDPWALPASPNASDKEGTDSGVLTGATDRASVTSTLTSKLIHVTKSGATGDRLAGTDWAETMSDGDHWTIGIRDGYLYQDYQAVGMYVCDSTFTEAYSLALIHDGASGYLQRKDWTNTGTGAGAATNYTNPGLNHITTLPIFLRIKRNTSTSWDIYVSLGGYRYWLLAGAYDIGFTVARVGIAAYSATNTIDVAADVAFLRKNWTP